MTKIKKNIFQCKLTDTAFSENLFYNIVTEKMQERGMKNGKKEVLQGICRKAAVCIA